MSPIESLRETADRIIFKLDYVRDLTSQIDIIVGEYIERLVDDPDCNYELFMKDVCHTITLLQVARSVLKDEVKE